MPNARTPGPLLVLILTTLISLPGCFVKKDYVDQEYGKMRTQVDEVKKANAQQMERIDSVDKKAQQGIATAGTADQKATQAGTTAQTAQQTAEAADRKGDTANQGVQQADNRLTTIENRIANIGDTYTTSQKESVLFKFNSSALSKDANGSLDKIASAASGMKTGYMVEIQGFSDSVGSESYNLELSSRRADNVQRYLLSKGLPLYRISVLGLGKDDPIADNKTKTGRDQNRRVEVTLLKSGSARAN